MSRLYPGKIKFNIINQDRHISHYISLASPKDDLDALQGSDDIVAPHIIKVIYSYPLKAEFMYIHKSNDKQGFTRRELANVISNKYHDIYNEENNSVGDPGHIPGMLNRNISNGPYGIWGHDIGDLVLHTVQRTHMQDNVAVYQIGIDS